MDWGVASKLRRELASWICVANLRHEAGGANFASRGGHRKNGDASRVGGDIGRKGDRDYNPEGPLQPTRRGLSGTPRMASRPVWLLSLRVSPDRRANS
ncbi:hypothetical protein [Paraburkholderia acidipaludis]|uniref:hypothetical protein n=1 Tax=Paraburkholderia acidipaludis TaxID=660537 RepID=UPI0012EB19B1|nr:hypothetical protein [Paraburkholderia acidipaludis]